MAHQQPMTATTRMVDPDLVADTPEGPALCGATCTECATTTFPAQERCPRCSALAMDPTLLPRRGTLWAYTVQHFAPKPPFRHDGEFEPFGLGYVDLGPVIVESRLTVSDVTALSPGLPVRLVLVPAFTDDGTTVTTFAFEPEEQ
jgi:uncharacterized OB-fold protein